MKMPKQIFAIGGAGKDIIYKIFEKEWILRGILEPDFTKTNVNVTIIDTALDEADGKDGDIEKIMAIREKIKTIQDEMRLKIGADKFLGNIEITYELLTNRMVLNTPQSLIAIGDQVKKSTGAAVWWMNDKLLGDMWSEKVMDHENLRQLNFARGVYRKRAIAKAIYFKAISEGHFKPNILDKEDIAIIAGLGGGTGSGMSIDLAKRLKSIQPMANIALFGILSTLKESQDEKVNSFAMLSELEYTCLNRDKNILKNIILVPIEQTKCRGRQSSRNEDKKLLEEFDNVFPQMFVSYYNRGHGSQDVFDNLPNYAPFIVATAQLIRYNIEEIKKFREDVNKVLKDKELAMDDEKQIYSNVQKFIDEFYRAGNDIKTLSSDEDRWLVNDRISKFKSIMENEFFSKQLQYNSVMHMKSAFAAGIKVTNSNSIEDQILNIRSQIDAIAVQSFKDITDEALFNVLKRDIDMIDELKNILISINRIHDVTIKNAMRFVITNSNIDLGREITNIIVLIRDQNNDKAQLNEKIGSLELKLKKFEAEVAKSVEVKTREWKENESKKIGLLDSIDTFSSTLNKNLMVLKSELDEFVKRLNTTNRVSDIKEINTLTIENMLEDIYRESLNKIELEYKDKNLINESLRNLKELKKNQIKEKKGVSTLDKWLKTGRYKNHILLSSEIISLTTRIERAGVFKIEKGKISNIYRSNVETVANTKKAEILNAIIQDSKNMFPTVSDELFNSLKVVLEDTIKRKDVSIESIIKAHNNYDVEIVKINEDLMEKRNELSKLSNKLKVYEAVIPTLKTMPAILVRYFDRLVNYHTYVANIEAHSKAIYDQRKKPIYVTDIQPTNILQIMTVQNDINGMLNDNSEISNLKAKLEEALIHTMDNKYNTLVQNTIASKDGKRIWKNSKAGCSIVTIAKNVEPAIIGTEMRVRNTFGIQGETDYSDWVCQYGDPWEIGIVMFISGVPLDNIVNVVDAGEGFNAYYKKIEPKVFLNHSYMLEEGKLVKRKAVLNIEAEDQKAILLKENKEIEAWYANNFEIMEIQKCL